MIIQNLAYGPSIRYVHKLFRKANISKPLIRVRIWGLEVLVFQKILRTYLMDDPLSNCKYNEGHRKIADHKKSKIENI